MKRHSGRTYVTGQISSLLPAGLCGELSSLFVIGNTLALPLAGPGAVAASYEAGTGP